MGKATKIRYLVLLLVLAFLGYNSVYFERLDERETVASSGFDAESYARDYLENQLPAAIADAIGIDELQQLLESDKEKAFDEYSHALAVGNIRFFLVKGEGRILEVGENKLLVATSADSNAASAPSGMQLEIATEYIFGNAIRDASGIIRMDQFENTQDLNDLAASINKIIREEVIPPFKAAAAPGKLIHFTGAIELNQKYPGPDRLELIPVSLSYIQ